MSMSKPQKMDTDTHTQRERGRERKREKESVNYKSKSIGHRVKEDCSLRSKISTQLNQNKDSFVRLSVCVCSYCSFVVVLNSLVLLGTA